MHHKCKYWEMYLMEHKELDEGIGLVLPAYFVLEGQLLKLMGQTTKDVLSETANDDFVFIRESKYREYQERSLVLANSSQGGINSKVAAAYKNAGMNGMSFSDELYREAGHDIIPVGDNEVMRTIINSYASKSAVAINNLTRTTAIQSSNNLINEIDRAYIEIISGNMTAEQAIQMAVRNLADTGIRTVDYSSSRRMNTDTAIRNILRTGINQSLGKLQEYRLMETGHDLVETTAHHGARPTHAVWQGLVFSWSGSHPDYPSFFTETGYGTDEGLCGYGCRHNFFPFFEGLSERAYTDDRLKAFEDEMVTYDGKEMSRYDATQLQHNMERNVRGWERRRNIKEAAGLSTDKEDLKIDDWRSKWRDLNKQTGLQVDYSLLKVN